MSRLSILIPYLGNAKLLEDTLVSVLENRPEDSEILVVLARHYEDPYDLGDEVRFLPTPSRAGLIGCLNFGLGMTRAEIVHVLLCGTEVAEGWIDHALGHFDDPRIACVASVVLDAQAPNRVVAAGMDYRPGGKIRLLGHATGLATLGRNSATVLSPHPAAAFYRRTVLEAMGRFDTEVADRLGGLDLALRLEHAGYRTVLEPCSQVRLLPGAKDQAGAFRRALDAERFFWRWAPVAGWTRSLALHALHLAADGCRTLFHPRVAAWAAGRLLGCSAIGDHRHCQQRLEWAERSQAPNSALAAPHFVPGSAGPVRAGAVAVRR